MTTENNILIAEFMELNLYRGNWYKSTIATEKKISKENSLLYHSDWNWLMSVVEKIESLDKKEGTIYNIVICDNICRIDTQNEEISWKRNKTKIEAVYNAVIEFIKWHNENSADKN